MRQQDRYIDFHGNPIYSSLPEQFFKAADVQAGTIASLSEGFLYYAQTSNQPGLTMADTALRNIFWGVIARMYVEPLCLWKFSSLEKQNKCIDTSPDRNTVPTLGKYGVRARETAWRYMFFTSAFAAGTLAADVYKLLGTGSWDSSTLTSKASYLTHMISGFRRFNKIAKGEWVIVDMPEPEEALEGDLAFELKA